MPDLLVFLLELILSAAGILMLMRFMLQLAQADFYSPWTQGIVRLTDSVCRGLRQFLPRSKRIDPASLIVAWAIYSGLLFMHFLDSNAIPGVFSIIGLGLYRVLDTIAVIYLIGTFIAVIMSWIDVDRNFPITRLAGEITAPVMEPTRRLLPSFGGLDLSPMIVIIGLVTIRGYILPEIKLLFL